MSVILKYNRKGEGGEGGEGGSWLRPCTETDVNEERQHILDSALYIYIYIYIFNEPGY